jgi:hypothetical protein
MRFLAVAALVLMMVTSSWSGPARKTLMAVEMHMEEQQPVNDVNDHHYIPRKDYDNHVGNNNGGGGGIKP